MNGSIGIVRMLCFNHPDCDHNDSPRLKYAKFLGFYSASTATVVKNCCSIEAMPLMICKSLSIHKSQGMTVGQGKPFTKVVVYLPPSGNKCPGLELVAVSKAVPLNDFAVRNTETELTRHTLYQG
eukprot:scaffold129946_cov34-Cyclotella_meneghiniana.AAC.1